MNKKINDQWMILLFVLAFSLQSSAFSQEKATVRVAHFSNITHAQGLILHATGKLEEMLGPEAVVDWKVFNAGPSVIEALFAGQMDIAYIGPSPAVNGFIKSQGAALAIIAGSSSGGAALVVREGVLIEKPEDFKGKKIASPQLGNTQDVSLRAWIKKQGLKLKEVGGDVQVLPVANPDQVTLFLKQELDAAWTVEPWVSILTKNTNAKVFLEESSIWPEGHYATTVVIVRKKFLETNPELVKKFLQAHVEITEWIGNNPEEAKAILMREMEKETGKALPDDVLESSLKRVRFVTDPLKDSVHAQAQSAFEAGFLKKQPDLEGLFETGILEELIQK